MCHQVALDMKMQGEGILKVGLQGLRGSAAGHSRQSLGHAFLWDRTAPHRVSLESI